MSDGNLGWLEAIMKVLGESSESMSYTDISTAIIEQGLRRDYGATPAATVNSVITRSIEDAKKEGSNNSPFIRTERGCYSLRNKDTVASLQSAQIVQPDQIVDEAIEETGLINAFGIYWSRDKVRWTPTPKILGREQTGANDVDFCRQKGVYLLYDGRAIIYVGRMTQDRLGMRLFEHTRDRLEGRWDRFSWFGIYPVKDDASLGMIDSSGYSPNLLVITMEALLIEGLEPPQNRKRGDRFKAKEFLQVIDPELREKKNS